MPVEGTPRSRWRGERITKEEADAEMAGVEDAEARFEKMMNEVPPQPRQSARDPPEVCPRCGQPYVTEGHSHGASGRVYPAWVCDRDACGIAVAWREETKPCGIDGCENEHEVMTYPA